MRGLSGLRLHYLLCGRRCQAWDPDVLGRTLESMSVSAVGNLPPLPAARRPPIAAQGCYPSCPERRCSGVAAVTARSHLGARGRSPTLEASAAVAASGGRAAEASKGRAHLGYFRPLRLDRAERRAASAWALFRARAVPQRAECSLLPRDSRHRASPAAAARGLRRRDTGRPQCRTSGGSRHPATAEPRPFLASRGVVAPEMAEICFMTSSISCRCSIFQSSKARPASLAVQP